MFTKQDWDWLVINSHYQTAVAVREALNEGKIKEAQEGVDALIEAMERSERRAVQSQLIRLMAHVIKWKCQPERRGSSWAITINSARREITYSQEEMPSLNRDFIESIWDKCFRSAMKEAAMEMNKKCDLTSLSWEEVFEDEYTTVEEE